MQTNDYLEVISTTGNILHFKLKSFWNDEVCNALGDKLVQTWKQAVDSFRGEKFIILSEQTDDFKPLSAGAKDILEKNMVYCKAKGVIKGIDIITSAITRMTMGSVEKNTDKGGFREIVTTLSEGRRRVAELKKEHNL